MLKKLFLPLFFLLSAGFCFAAQDTPVKMLGKNKGKVNIINKNGAEYVQALPLSKILKLQTTWFRRSGQLNLKGPGGFFCVLRDGQNSAVINGEPYSLDGALFMQDRALYAPLSFFTSEKLRFYTGYNVSYSGSEIIIEKPYNLEFLEFKDDEKSANIILKKQGRVSVNKDSRGKYFAEIFFPDALVKREKSLDPESPFIENIKIRQEDEGVSMRVQLKGKGRSWEVFEGDGYIAFSCGEESPASPLYAYVPKQDLKPSVLVENSPLQKPSILEENTSLSAESSSAKEEDFIELGDDFFAETPTAAQKTNTAAKKTTAPKTTVVNKLVTAKEYAERNKPANPKERKFRVLIDPGHGGKDPGAVRRGSSKEKELNLDVAKRLYNLLRKEKNFEVKISRNTDVFIALGERAKMGNDFKADVFISIHANAAKRASANGFEVYFRSDKASDAEAAETAALENEALQYEGKSGGNVSFADLLLKSLATNENINQSSKLAGHIRNSVNTKKSSIGIKVHQKSAIKQANFYVLRGVHAPAVLVEMGYLSNAQDRKKLNTKNVRQKIAEAIRSGVLSYAKAEGWK